MKTHNAVLIGFVCTLAAACADNLDIPQTNVTPVAVARLLDDTSPMPTVTLSGASALELTLDASKSRDPDGSIRSYRWLSATTLADLTVAESSNDAGAAEPTSARWVPDGEPADWPDDIEQPQIRLQTPGNYSFILWVIDDRGRISDPNTLTIQAISAAAEP